MSDTRPDHERIWLQPSCPTCRGIDDRTWCQDNVWSEGCSPGDCDKAPTEYIRADLATPPAVVAALVEALEGIADALEPHEPLWNMAQSALAAYREAGR